MVNAFQQNKPKDYVIATGKYYSVKDFIEMTSKHLEQYNLEGSGVNEKGFDDNNRYN